MTRLSRLGVSSLLCVLAVSSTSAGAPVPGKKGRGSMTRDEAVRLVQAVFKSVGQQSPGLNEKGFGGVMLGVAQVYFEHQAASQKLVCRAHIFTFPKEPEPGKIAGFEQEEQSGTPTGGGRFEYMPENKGIFLTRSYDKAADAEVFVREVGELAKASLVWRDEVFARVMERFFGSRKKTPSPVH